MCKRVGVWRQSGKCVFVCECVYIVELTVFHFLLFREHFLPFFPQLKHQQSYYVGWFIPPLSPSLPSSHCRIWTAGQKANDVVFFVFFPTNLELHQSIVFYWRWHIVFVFLSCWYFLLTTEVASFSCTPVNNQSGFSPDKHSLRCTSMSVLIIIPTLYLLSDSRVRRIMVPTTCCTRLVLRAGDLLLHRSFSSIYLKGQKEKYKSAHRRREMEKWRKK